MLLICFDLDSAQMKFNTTMFSCDTKKYSPTNEPLYYLYGDDWTLEAHKGSCFTYIT